MKIWTAVVVKSEKYKTPYPLSSRLGDDEFSEIEAETEQDALEYVLAHAPRWAKEAALRGDIIVKERTEPLAR